MICSVCHDKGIVSLPWTDAPDDYAVCLCSIGRAMRSTKNYKATVMPLWKVWCAREQVHPSRMSMIEDWLPDEELAAHGWLTQAPAVDREAALLAASKTRRAKL